MLNDWYVFLHTDLCHIYCSRLCTHLYSIIGVKFILLQPLVYPSSMSVESIAYIYQNIYIKKKECYLICTCYDTQRNYKQKDGINVPHGDQQV